MILTLDSTWRFLFENVFKAVLALLASALLLFAIGAIRVESGSTHGDDGEAAIEITGSRLQAVVGTGETRGNSLVFTRYQSQDDELTAVAVWRGQLAATDFPLLSYQIDAAVPGPEVKLIWRTASDPGVLRSADLQATGTDTAWLDLELSP
ncbi:MAG: hypothetical protein R3E50_07415, partial [Halioglobus sp.]